MKVLVTGGSGFIGSHLTNRLAKDKKVSVIDLWLNPEIEVNPRGHNIQFLKGNVLNEKLIAEAVSDVDVVYHLAGILGTSETIEEFNPAEVTKVNILGTLNVLEASRKANVKRLVFVSTPDVPWLNPYKITKHAAEKYCQMYKTEHGLNTIVLKLTNVYGPRERCKQLPSSAKFKYQKVVPTFITCALLNKPLPVFGDGEQSSDYIYVSDVVDALVLASVKNVVDEHIIPIGTGVDCSVNSLAHKIIELTGSKSGIVHLPMRRGEVKTHIKTDTSISKRSLGFKAKVDLNKGLIKTIPYYAEKLGIRWNGYVQQ